jgi:capsular polysaccharide transport system ATP-binding protein
MIRLENLCKTYVMGGMRKVVADRITATFPDRTGVAILGRNGTGKSTLLRMIAGTQDHDSGRILRTGTISWPVGFAGSFHGDLSGLQNTRFIARVHGVDTDELVDYVRDFAELGAHFFLPVRTYSAGMRARLAFGISMGIRFDTYLVDEATATGDHVFRDKSERIFHERLQDSAVIMVTHSPAQVRRICQEGAVLENGRLHYYKDVQDAIDHHMENGRRARAEGAA